MDVRMHTTPNGDTDMQQDFEWKPEYDSLLNQIALTDAFDTDWTRLREIIQYKIAYNIRQYLLEDPQKQEHNNARTPPEPLPRSSPMSLPSSSPPSFLHSSTASLAHQGLIIPPFPRRERRRDGPMRIHRSIMDEKEAEEIKGQIFEQLGEFDNPPFTIQRVCELCVQPKRHYKTIGKYLRALERTILVTSTREAFQVDIGDDDTNINSTYGNMEALRLASTPLMSPIPFLHDDARRSRSPSPFELAATKRPAGSSTELDPPSVDPLSVRKPLGLVDELDDPKPGHLADHPTALTSVTSTGPAPVPPSLSERFVKSSTPEPEEGSKDTPETAESRQAEDAEVEDMVLDNTLEDEDKENRPS